MNCHLFSGSVFGIFRYALSLGDWVAREMEATVAMMMEVKVVMAGETEEII